eukprot:5559746-Pyramimonas_sp.AAC.1
MLSPPAAIESDDIFANRSLPGMVRPNLGARRLPTMLSPTATLERGDSFANRNPPGMARSSLGPRR